MMLHAVIMPKFQSTPSSRRETITAGWPTAAKAEFQSTPSSRRETSTSCTTATRTSYFNPLPPRGGRPEGRAFARPSVYFNPLPPRGGRRSPSTRTKTTSAFQSTPSSRRETRGIRSAPPSPSDFNPLPPRGGRPGQLRRRGCAHDFNPLPPRGGRLVFTVGDNALPDISIHSLLAEGDSVTLPSLVRLPYFNPLPPRGGRHRQTMSRLSATIFQSTPSSRRETWWITLSSRPKANFNPLPPRGGRPVPDVCPAGISKFQSTPSSRRETAAVARGSYSGSDFNPLPPRGGRRQRFVPFYWPLLISIHSLLAEGDRTWWAYR